ncbi:MAG: hypothetical protein ACJA16_005317 [Akkermansiaceae bacterium]|jgi:hypothetical protein
MIPPSTLFERSFKWGRSDPYGVHAAHPQPEEERQSWAATTRPREEVAQSGATQQRGIESCFENQEQKTMRNLPRAPQLDMSEEFLE